jgi:NADPH:quinone reductase-like Zn-dependent oxidoreductase
MIMRAIVYTAYGPPEVLQLKEVERPTPKDNEVLVKVHATPVSYGDLTARNFKNIPASEFHMPLPLLLPARMTFGFNTPKINILGSEFAGEVAATGKDVKRFKPGDAVIGYLGQRMGAYAEYVCMPEDGSLALKPANMSFVEAATIPYGAIMASSLLKRANLHKGCKVLVNGASGGMGSAAVQLAKYYGAEFTGVCGTPRLDYVKSLGADQVIDYTREDFTQNGETYDLIFDVLGKSSFAKCKKSLKPDGIYLLASFKMKAVFQMLRTKIAGSQKVVCAMASENTEHLVFVKELVEGGKYRSIIDRCFSLEQAAEAHRYVEAGLERGRVVITVEQGGTQ